MGSPSRRLPSPQRVSAVAMILVQAGVLAWLMDARAFAGCVVPVALAGLFASGNGLSRGFSQTVANSLILGFFGLRYLVASTDLDPDRQFINSPLALEVSSACLVIQLSTLFQAAYVDRLPIWFLAASSIGYVFSGDVRLPIMLREEFLLLNAAYFIGWGVYGSACRRRRIGTGVTGADGSRFAILAMVFLTSTIALAGLTRAFQKYEHAFERWLSDQLHVGRQIPGGIGFSGTGSLSEITNFKNMFPEARALAVFGTEPPGYLRGRVFQEFDGREWSDVSMRRPIGPTTEPGMTAVLPRPKSRVFQVHESLPERPAVFDVWPQNDQLAWYVFAPLKTAVVASEAGSMMLSDDRIVTWVGRETPSPYTVLTDDAPFEDPGSGPATLQIPADLDPGIRSLAGSLFRKATTFAEKRQAVEEFFRESFQYRIGGAGRSRRFEDRLTNFLLDDHAGHCELFATATALLLRLGGVPTRYVTGFVAAERNPYDGTWIARNKDGHAWVEAFDAESNVWVTVETTPGDGRPAPSAKSGSTQVMEAITAYFKRIRVYFRLGLIQELALSVVLPFGVPALLGAAIWLAMRGRRRRVRAGLISGPAPLPTDLELLARERETFDVRLKRIGLERRASETILAFADRIGQHVGGDGIERIADWYRRYAELRYRDRPVEPAALAAIREDRRRIPVVRKEPNS